MSEKIYCGNGKVRETKFGQMLGLSFSEEDVRKLQENLSNGWVNVNVNKRKEPSDKGVTHYLTVDTWKPENKKEDFDPEGSLPF